MRRRSNQSTDRELHNKIDNLTRLVEELTLEQRRERDQWRQERERLLAAAAARVQRPRVQTPVATRVPRVETPPEVVHATRVVDIPQERP